MSKGVRTDTVINEQINRYECQLFFSGATDGFNTSDAIIAVELIHIKKRQKVKLAKLDINLQNKTNIIKSDCKTSIIGLFVILRHSPLPMITKIRAIHNSSKNSKIFFDGFEINNQMTGERTFFAVESYIESTDLDNAIVHNVKPTKLTFFSKQTIFPDFIIIDYESYGEPINVLVDSPDEIHAVKLEPKINWFESLVFGIFLIQVNITIMVTLLTHFVGDKRDLQTGHFVITILVSSLLAFIITQITAFAYRFGLKPHYNLHCSPLKQQLNKSSVLWQIFRYSYLGFYIIVSLSLSVFDIYYSPHNFKIQMLGSSDDYMTEVLSLLLLLVFNVIVIYLIWIPIFSVIRFIYRLSALSRAKSKSNESIEDYETNMKSIKEEKSEKFEKSEKSEKWEKKCQSPNETRSRLEDNITDDSYSKQKTLNTGSIIVKPTKSVGYIDPEVFKLTQSKIDATDGHKDLRRNSGNNQKKN
ncbi:uncharacterized protein LOC128960351 [Oppia nitens]|uniref:uncharacterized protein LOC128960351 n=1 Tax=Oppia nitens TaxID=1686743 RepID=UPI0023DAACF0|nr:uncharacterized protein LOC128960351 [Oppia nitens]